MYPVSESCLDVIKYYYLSLRPSLRVPVPPLCVHRDTHTNKRVLRSWCKNKQTKKELGLFGSKASCWHEKATEPGLNFLLNFFIAILICIDVGNDYNNLINNNNNNNYHYYYYYYIS